MNITSTVFRILYFLFFIFLPYIVPIGAFASGAYIFFRQEKYFIAILFLVTAILFLIMLLLKRFPLSAKKIEWLKLNGQKMMTEFVSLERKWNTRVNGEPPFVIYSKANGRIFKSELLWPSSAEDTFYINDANTRALETLQKRETNTIYLIPVYLNANKPRQYYMDLGGLEIKNEY